MKEEIQEIKKKIDNAIKAIDEQKLKIDNYLNNPDYVSGWKDNQSKKFRKSINDVNKMLDRPKLNLELLKDEINKVLSILKEKWRIHYLNVCN